MPISDFRVIEVRAPEYGDKAKIPEIINNCFAAAKEGWQLQELREQHIMQSDQRDGQHKKLIGWLLILTK